MKDKRWKSIRTEIVLYSLISLFLALLTEAVLFATVVFGSEQIRNMRKEDQLRYEINNSMTNNSMTNNGLNIDRTFGGESISNELQRMEKSREHQPIVIATTILTVIALFILYFLCFMEKISMYLNEITEGIREISMGNFESRVVVRQDNELTEIAVGLNKMTGDVRRIMENERKNEQAKNELITNVAHDLRTPLTSIIGYLALVDKDEQLEEETRKHYIGIAYDKSKRLENLIEDLFTYTKITVGEIPLKPREMDLIKMMEQLLDEFYPLLQDAGLQCEFHTKYAKLEIVADGELLARAIANLISNAIKYGKDGKMIHMELDVIKPKSEKPKKSKLVKNMYNTTHLKEKVFMENGSKPQEELGERIRIRITNYGQIIPAQDLKNIFDKFFRVESSRSSETGGTGLGLAIARNAILMHGGSIRVKSDFNGTTFEILLPPTFTPTQIQLLQEDEAEE